MDFVETATSKSDVRGRSKQAARLLHMSIQDKQAGQVRPVLVKFRSPREVCKFIKIQLSLT